MHFLFVFSLDLSNHFCIDKWRECVFKCDEILSRITSSYNKKKIEFSETYKTEHYYEIAGLRTSFFTLFLLLRMDEHGIAYSPQVNMRIASAENLKTRASFGKSLLEHCFKEDDPGIFDSNPVKCIFYEYKMPKKEPFPKLYSVGYENLDPELDDDDDLRNKYIRMTDGTALPVSENAFVRLAFLLNIKPKIVDRDGLNEEYGIHDYGSILSHKRAFLSSKEEFSTYVAMTLAWEAFEFDDEKSLAWNIFRLRLFFNMMSNVGIAAIEGNHRLFLANKVLMGTRPGDMVPITKEQTKDQNIERIPNGSPILQSIAVTVSMPRYKSFKLPSEGTPISKTMTKKFKEWSKQVATGKETHLASTWKTWTLQTIEGIADDDIPILTIEEFIQLPVRKRLDISDMSKSGDKFERAVSKIQLTVAKFLLGNSPPKLIANKAKARLLIDKKPGYVDFDKNQFLENFIKNPAYLGYRVNNFPMVSTFVVLHLECQSKQSVC
jgi:hypothetical protein